MNVYTAWIESLRSIHNYEFRKVALTYMNFPPSARYTCITPRNSRHKFIIKFFLAQAIVTLILISII